MKRLIAVLSLTLAAAACSTTDETTDGGTPNTDGGTSNTDGGTSSIEPKLSVIQTKIFDRNCTVCHSASAPSAFGSLALTAGKSFDQLVNQNVKGSDWPSKYQKRVVPGDTATSALSASIEHRTDISANLYMPQGSSLTQDEINAINTWIANGAQND